MAALSAQLSVIPEWSMNVNGESCSDLTFSQLGMPLGKGTFGTVHRLHGRPNRVIKLMHREEGQHEIETYQKLQNKVEGIPRYYNIYNYQRPGFPVYYAIEMERVQANLYERYLEVACRKGKINYSALMPVDKVVELAGKALRILATVHREGILHGDIKPENISADLKIFDWGLDQNHHKRDSHRGLVTSVWYRAPEIVFFKCYRGCRYNCKIDSFSLGIFLSEMLTGISPLSRSMEGLHAEHLQIVEQATERKIQQKYLEGKEDFVEFSRDLRKWVWRFPVERATPYTRHIQQATRRGHLNEPQAALFIDLIDKLVDPDPETRSSCEEALAHSLFTPRSRTEEKEPITLSS